MRAILVGGMVLAIFAGVLIAMGGILWKHLRKEHAFGAPMAAGPAAISATPAGSAPTGAAPTDQPQPAAADAPEKPAPLELPMTIPAPLAPATQAVETTTETAAEIQHKKEQAEKKAAELAIEKWASDLKKEDPAVQVDAAVALARHDDPRGLAFLKDAINGDDVTLREQATAAVGKLGGPAAIKILIDRVNGHGYDGPAEAVDALVAMGEPAIAPMAASLPTLSENARWQMLPGIARMGEPAMKGLTDMLPNADIKLKKTICQVMGGMGERPDVTHKPVEPLLALLSDPDRGVRRAAAHGLELLHWQPATAEEEEMLKKAK